MQEGNKKIKSIEGNIFLIPLRNHGYGVGLITRKNKNEALGYFFNLKLNSIPAFIEIKGLLDKPLILVKKFGALGLNKGAWPIIGHLDKFNKAGKLLK